MQIMKCVAESAAAEEPSHVTFTQTLYLLATTAPATVAMYGIQHTVKVRSCMDLGLTHE